MEESVRYGITTAILWHCTEADLTLQLLQLANNQFQGQILAASVYNHPVQNWQ